VIHGKRITNFNLYKEECYFNALGSMLKNFNLEYVKTRFSLIKMQTNQTKTSCVTMFD